MNAHGYEEVDHTADIAIKVWAEDFYSLLIQAARGFYDLVGFEYSSDEKFDCQIVIQPGSLESTLVDFLSELLFFFEDKSLMFVEFVFDDRIDGLFIQMLGCKVERPTLEIKAVTFHNMNILQTKNGFSVTITFDV